MPEPTVQQSAAVRLTRLAALAERGGIEIQPDDIADMLAVLAELTAAEAGRRQLHQRITAAQNAIDGERNFAMLRLDTGTEPGIVVLDALRNVGSALAGPLAITVEDES